MSIHYRSRQSLRAGSCIVVVLFIGFGIIAQAYSKHFPPPPANKNVTISNGGLSVTFNTAWGAVVVGIANKNVAHGLNIVDSNDVGRELQPTQFLFLTIGGRRELIRNISQPGAEGYWPFYQHPKGVVFPEKSSPVVQWNASRDHFHAVIKPLDYLTGNPTTWVYVEDVVINSQGVARFHYTFYNHELRTYIMGAVMATLYTDRTGTFMYPLISPYGKAGVVLRKEQNIKWPVEVITRAPAWPQKQKPLTSKGWIANVDITDNLGIFYTTPVGLGELYRTYPGADVSDRLPLGQTGVVANDLTSYPGEIFSIDFSVVVSTPQRGPALISQQPAAVFRILHNRP